MKQNALRLYKHFCELAENPKGADSSERETVKFKALKSKAEFEHRFKNVKKYRKDPDFQKMFNNEVKEKPKTETVDVKEELKKEFKDGKKPKR